MEWLALLGRTADFIEERDPFGDCFSQHELNRLRGVGIDRIAEAASDELTIAAVSGDEAQHGINDVFPGDAYPIGHCLKSGLDKLRAEASRGGAVPSSVVFRMTDPLMDMLERVRRRAVTKRRA